VITPTTALCTDVRGVAVMLNISVRSVHRLNDGAKMPAPIAFGNARRWRIREIEAWLRSGSPVRKSWTWNDAS
jgi:predicted DNA-binding transcriptional regulator AlpA